jgi:hypothetical protein
MKKLILILFAIILAGCTHNYKKSDLLGTWDIFSLTYFENGEVELVDDNESWSVEVGKDSIKFRIVWDEQYTWKIKGDSILIDDISFDYSSFYIKELTSEKIIVEYDKGQFTFKKRK